MGKICHRTTGYHTSLCHWLPSGNALKTTTKTVLKVQPTGQVGQNPYWRKQISNQIKLQHVSPNNYFLDRAFYKATLSYHLKGTHTALLLRNLIISTTKNTNVHLKKSTDLSFTEAPHWICIIIIVKGTPGWFIKASVHKG